MSIRGARSSRYHAAEEPCQPIDLQLAEGHIINDLNCIHFSKLYFKQNKGITSDQTLIYGFLLLNQVLDTPTVEPQLSGPPLSRTSIIRLGSFLIITDNKIRKWACPSNAHVHCSCYHGNMPAYLLRMRRQPCGTAVYQ